MRIALVHNPDAGDGTYARDELRHLLETAGHRVQEFGKRTSDVVEAIRTAPDVLAVAGGDGTAARAAIASFEAGSTAPLFILPTGTSNNIARSLGLDRPIPSLIRALAEADTARLDIGSAEGPLGANLFVEGAGVGFMGAMLHHPPSRAKLAISAIRGVVTGTGLASRQASGIARIIREQPALSLAIVADGEDLSGDYIGAEAMNIRELGPNIALAPGTDPGDGLLDLVLFLPDQREDLARRVERRTTAFDPPPSLARRARRIELSWPADHGHVDDAPWPETRAGDDARVSLTIIGGVTVLEIRRDGPDRKA